MQKRQYEKPMLDICGEVIEKTLGCCCSNPITIPGYPGKWCDEDDC